MTDKEKLEKIKELADAMYYAAQQLTTDASRLHKAMNEYHKFIIHECKEESVSNDLEEAAEMFIDSLIPTEVDTVTPFAAEYVIGLLNKAIEFGSNWQKQQMMKDAVDGKIYETQARSKLKAATIGKISGLKYRVGDKVKLIILKED